MMPLTVIEKCPKCQKVLEATGKYLETANLVSKECCVIECRFCGHVFLSQVQDREE
jgi:hypothetical protein